jgi:hypothetical protein
VEWITANANNLTATILLLVAVYGRYKQWWVDGPTHDRCLTEVKELESRLWSLSDSGAVTTATLNRTVNAFLDAEERRSTREPGM